MRAAIWSVLVLCACPSGPASRPDTTVPVTAPVIPAKPTSIRPEVRHERLDNGLDVYLVPDHASPLVVVQIWVRAGSRDEHEAPNGADHGITGLSHFFEHLMFQGTARFPDYDQALTPLGAQNNAFTYQDATVFWAYTPKGHLRLILDIEADRFQHMKVDFLHVEPEREVVKSERRDRTDSSPANLAEERAVRNAFDVRPYRWGPIGWMGDLDAITLEETQAYHAAHYHPAGAFIVIAGDLDPDQTLAWVRELWGGIPARAAVERAELPEESWRGPRTDHVIEDSETTTVVWAYRSPPPGGATRRAYAALELIDWVLTAGKSARLQKRLVFNDEPKLSELGASLMALGDPWVYTWQADLLDGVSVGSIEAVLDEEMQRIARDGVSPDELQRAVAGLRTDVVHGILSNSDRAEGIGFSLVATGDPFAQFERLESYAAITQDELKAAAAQYLVAERRSRVTVVTPRRLLALADAWAARAPIGSLAEPLKRAVAFYVEVQQHEKNIAEADREERAIAMLAQRADIAKARASADEKKAIDKYLSESESGTVKRRARLAVTRKALSERQKELELRQRALNEQVALSERGAARPDPLMREAVKLLLAPTRHGIAVPLPPKELAPHGEPALALHTIAAWVCASRGLQKTAQRAREFVLREGVKLGAAAGPLAKAAYGIAYDTSIEGLPLDDLPLFTERPTRSTP